MGSVYSLALRAGVAVGAALSMAGLVTMPAQAVPGNSGSAVSVATQNKWANIGTGKCLDVRAGSLSDSAIIQQFSCKNELHQRFWTEPLLGEPYTFITPGHAALMCVQPTTLDSHGVIVQRSCTHTDGQKWQFVWQNGGALIKNKVSGLCLADAGMPNGSRREVRQLPCTGEAGQLWLNRS